MDRYIRRPILLLALCSALDEIVTFINLSNGCVELNLRIAWMMSINPLLYPICDGSLLLIAWTLHEQLISRKIDLWFLWTATGVVRLLCVAFSLS